MKSQPRTVLFIDNGLSFGGSLIVTAMLIKYLDPKRYRAVVVGEAEEHVLRYLFGETSTYYRLTRPYDYVDRVLLRERFGGSEAGLLKRVVRYVLHAANRGRNVGYYGRLALVIMRERVDLIHHSNGYVRSFLALFGRPLVGTLQGIMTTPYSREERRVLGHFGAMIAISEVVERSYLDAGGPPDIVRRLANPCDPGAIEEGLRAEVRKELKLAHSSKVFGILGRVVEWKGQREFLAAALKVLATVPDAVAMIVGDAADGADNYFDDLRATAARSPFSERVIFTGYVEDTRRVYAVLDVAVHASISPEPFGLVVIEAPGYGIPIVAADSGAPPEIVEHGVDGFLVNPRDSDALASAITTLLKNDTLRREMGEKGRSKVLAKYHAKPYAARVQEIYDAILDRDGKT